MLYGQHILYKVVCNPDFIIMFIFYSVVVFKTNPIILFPFLPGRRPGTSVQPDDAESAGLQWEPRASRYVSAPSHCAFPAPSTPDKLYHGHHGSAYGPSIQLPAYYRTPPSSTPATSSIPARHAGPTATTGLHAAPSTPAGMAFFACHNIKLYQILVKLWFKICFVLTCLV